MFFCFELREKYVFFNSTLPQPPQPTPQPPPPQPPHTCSIIIKASDLKAVNGTKASFPHGHGLKMALDSGDVIKKGRSLTKLSSTIPSIIISSS